MYVHFTSSISLTSQKAVYVQRVTASEIFPESYVRHWVISVIQGLRWRSSIVSVSNRST